MITMGLTEDKTPLVAALYARVSTGRQENEATIESQLDEITKRVEADGNILPEQNKFIDDGWTSEMLARPALDKVRDAAKEGKFQILYVYDRGRLSRIFFHQEIVISELADRDISFISLHNINATNPEERVMQSMQGVFDEYEKVKIAERFRRGKLYKARNGIIISGQALYGYRYIKKTEKTKTRWILNEEAVSVIRKIITWVAIDGLSIRGIIMKLYRLGIPPPKGKSDTWVKGTIVRLLQCETYFTGIAYYNKSEAVVAKHPIKNVKYKKVKRTSRKVRPREEWISFKVPKLFNESERYLFDRVQEILEDNKRYASKNRKYDYLLTGKTYCEHGFRRVGDGYSKGQNHYYRSAARIYEFPKETACDCRGVNAVVLDTLFWSKLQEILISPDLLRKQTEKWYKHQSDYLQSSTLDIERVNKQLLSVKEEGIRYARMCGEGQIDAEQLEELMRGVKIKKNQYLKEIEEIKSRNSQNKLNSINLDELCQEAQRVIKSLEDNKKRQIIRDLVEKIIIKKGGDEVETWIHIPLNQAHQMGYEFEGRNCRFTKCGKVHIV